MTSDKLEKAAVEAVEAAASVVDVEAAERPADSRTTKPKAFLGPRRNSAHRVMF
jgi:hypothetical protein